MPVMLPKASSKLQLTDCTSASFARFTRFRRISCSSWKPHPTPRTKSMVTSPRVTPNGLHVSFLLCVIRKSAILEKNLLEWGILCASPWFRGHYEASVQGKLYVEDDFTLIRGQWSPSASSSSSSSFGTGLQQLQHHESTVNTE